ncbi:MAG: hypothetical protein OEX81_02995 [Candidatus Pacebacteria bacterium]|nr:hypothetical protein [Candidatus Paceibacterota bacterium]
MKKWYVVSEAGLRVKIQSKHFTEWLANRARDKAEREEGLPFNPVMPLPNFVVMHESEWKRKDKKRSLKRRFK